MAYIDHMPPYVGNSVAGSGAGGVGLVSQATTDGLVVFQTQEYDITGDPVFVDLTSESSSDDGSPFTVQGRETRDDSTATLTPALYVGSEERTFYALIVKTLSISEGQESVWEYWDGYDWTEFNIQSTSGPELGNIPRAGHDLQNVDDAERIRFGDMPDWTLFEVDGVTAYWVRRYTTDDLASSVGVDPVVEQILLQPSQILISPDGTVELFGGSEVDRDIISGWPQTTRVLGSAPGSTDVLFGPNTSPKIEDNRFDDQQFDGFAVVLALPSQVNTAKPLKMSVSWAEAQSGKTGDVEIVVAIALARPGEVLDGSLSEDMFTRIRSVTVSEPDKLKVTEPDFEFDVSAYEPGDEIAIAITRDATVPNLNDTYNGDIYGVDFRLWGSFWR